MYDSRQKKVRAACFLLLNGYMQFAYAGWRKAMQEIDYTKIGMRIRQARKTKGWSQAELAKHCGISMSFLGHIERGTRIMSLDTFVNVCAAFGTDSDELLWGVVHPSNTRLVDMWGRTEGNGTDSYSMYIRIMKSVAEIMNEA